MTTLPKLTPVQINRLHAADPLDPGGVLRIDTSLDPDALAGSRILVNARIMLTALADQPAKATPTLKNLNRAFVRRMLDEMSWPPGYAAEVTRFCTVIDEINVLELSTLRSLLEVAGLVHRRSGLFHATRRAQQLLAPAQAGELFSLLLRTYLGRLNWALVSFGPEDYAMQESCVHALWVIRSLAANGVTVSEVVPYLEVDPLAWRKERHWSAGPDGLERAVRHRILDALWDFGLLERDPSAYDRFGPASRYIWCTTALFTRAISFDLAMPASVPEEIKVETIVTIKITLIGTEPPIWRRLEVPGSLDLGALHDVLNTSMGWLDYHLHAFEIEARRYGIPCDDFDDDDTLPEESVMLADLLAAGVRRFGYEYDFGDGWQHEIVLEASAVPHADTFYPRCIAGSRACPPEDCGGIGGFAEFLDVMADPDDPEHHEMVTWYGGVYDPDAFNPAENSAVLRVLATGKLPEE